MAHSQQQQNSYTIPFRHPHGGIVIGSKGRTIQQLQSDTGCTIISMKPDRDQGKHLPYFLIQGPNLKQVNLATISVLELLHHSMMNAEKKSQNQPTHYSKDSSTNRGYDGYTPYSPLSDSSQSLTSPPPPPTHEHFPAQIPSSKKVKFNVKN